MAALRGRHRKSDMQSYRQNSESVNIFCAERNPFRRAISVVVHPGDPIEELDMDTLRKQERAIRAFTESVEFDLPPAPELPALLDIDHYSFGMRESSTADTIIDVAKLTAEEEQIDKTKGETQKYRMAVPGPEHVDQEIEMHKSLLKNVEPDEESIEETHSVCTDTNANYGKRPTSITTTNPDFQDLKRQYSISAVRRPRPTTPTSWCVIDAYVQAEEEKGERQQELRYKNEGPPDVGAKIRVSIPNKEQVKTGQRERRNSMSWNQFYQSMEQPAYKQSRSEFVSAKNCTSSNIDFDAEWANAKTTGVWAESETAQMADKDKPDKSTRQSSVQSHQSNQETSQVSRQSSTQTVGRRTSQISDYEASQFSRQSSVQKKQSFITSPAENAGKTIADKGSTEQEGHVKPVRAAPPPPPKKSVANEAAAFSDYPTATNTEAPMQSEFGDPSQFYQGYDTDTYKAASYDPATYGNQTHDYSNYNTSYDPTTTNYDQSTYGAYDQTQYDSNAYAGYTSSGYDNYYQGYGEYNASDQTYSSNISEQPYTYDSNTGQYYYDYTQQQANYDYDPTTYNAGYDQGLQTSGVGADDTETSASVSPHPSVLPTGDEPLIEETNLAVDYQYKQYGQYDYNQQDYSAYPTTTTTDPEATASVTVNEPDVFDTSAYQTELQSDYSTYNTSASTLQYNVPAENVTKLPVVPLLPQQRARTPDPFGWEAQEKNYTETGSALPPPRPPPVTKTPEVDVAPDIAFSEPIASTIKEEFRGEPPSRPAPPTAKQPPRPPPPSNDSGSNRQMPPLPPPPPTKTPKQEKDVEEEEDPWARFKKMSEQVTSAVKSTEQQLKNLSETSAAKDVKDESYIGQIGGTQAIELTAAQKQILKIQEEQKKAKADKKARKSVSSKKNVVPQFDPKKEEDMEKAAAELVAKMAVSRAHDLEGWKPPTQIAEKIAEQELTESAESPASPEQEEQLKEPIEQEEEPTQVEQTVEVVEQKIEEDVVREGWAGFDTKFSDTNASNLPTSESDFFSTNVKFCNVENAFGNEQTGNNQKEIDPFAPTVSAFDADPFDTRPIEEIVAEAKQRAELEAELQIDENNLLHGSPATTRRSTSRGSSPTPEGGSPVSSRPMGFEDDFKAEYSHTSTPLYDEDDSQPLEEFAPKFTGEGWDLMIRHPLKKKSFMSERCWKPCFVRLGENNMLRVFNSKTDSRPILEILLQASYSLSDNTLQAYDQYGKIHTVKLQHVLYKERVGIRAGQISRLVEGHITKYGLPLEHAAQINVLAKFASLNADYFQTFVSTIEDVLFNCPTKRDVAPFYKQDEVQLHCHDEYFAHVDKLGNVSKQRARVRMFCLSFLSGSPFLEIGLNDRRREGKEIVRRKDILPMYTERWIRFEDLEFHNTVEQAVWDEDQVIKLQPPDSCFFEVMRFRVRPPRNREKPLTVKSTMRIAGSKVEIRIDVMAAAQQQLAKGTVESTRFIPCEDIQIKFPIPDAWIYIFREERTWGVGSVHSKTRRPGKVKNLKDRLIGAVQHTENTLIEVAIGEAKYEHVYRALVWRIPRLPEKHHQAYKSHLLKCRFQLSSFDLMPEEFLPLAGVEFTMPLATISNAVVRSVSVEQHEDSDRVEKFVRYVAKCHYDLDIDYVQCNNLDNDLDLDFEIRKHESSFNPDEVKAQHDGYKIEIDESKRHDGNKELMHEEPSLHAAWSSDAGENAMPQASFDFEAYARQSNGGTFPMSQQQDSSSEEEEEDKSKFPVIQIDMSTYGY